MDAYCSICGQGYDTRDPAITLHPGPEWECADEAACFDRRAASLLADAIATLTAPFTPGDPS
jgi:hypothetical protein